MIRWLDEGKHIGPGVFFAAVFWESLFPSGFSAPRRVWKKLFGIEKVVNVVVGEGPCRNSHETEPLKIVGLKKVRQGHEFQKKLHDFSPLLFNRPPRWI